jgi:hypothetical protein
MNVLVKKDVLNQIEQIADYISLQIKMPNTALRYTNRLIAFGLDLGKYYKLYPLCKNERLLKKGLHCADFEKKWVFVFSMGNKNIIIHQIIWAVSLH